MMPAGAPERPPRGSGDAEARNARARAEQTTGAGWNLLLLAAFLAGTALRVWQLDIQILIDDEWHAIHKLLHSSPLDIATHLGYADYSIPLTLYFQQLQR